MLLHLSVASHGSTCPGAQVRSGAPYPGAPQYKELGVNGRRDCVPCAELWERSALAPSEGLPFPLANINHSRQCVWQEALVFVGFSFFFLLAPLRLALRRGVPRLWCSQPKKAEHLSALPSRGQVAGGETAMEFGKQKRSIPDSIAIHGVTVVTSVSYSSGAGLEKNRSRGLFKQQLSLVPHCPWHPVLHGALRTAPRPAAGHGGCVLPLLAAGRVCRVQQGLRRAARCGRLWSKLTTCFGTAPGGGCWNPILHPFAPGLSQLVAVLPPAPAARQLPSQSLCRFSGALPLPRLA